MTLKDEILEELRRGTLLSEIKRKYRSVAATYSALRQFLEESERTVEERQEKLRELERELHEVN